MLTNLFDLPLPIVRAVAADPYDNQGSDATVTELIGPPRLAALRRAHADTLTEDASERVWSLWGRAIHHILEQAGRDLPDTLTETRLFTTVAGWRVSGALDTHSLVNHRLSDYKAVAWYGVKDGAKADYVAQSNLLTLLLHEHDHRVDEAEIVVLVRDHRQSDYKRYAADGYPVTPIKKIPVRLWSRDEQYAYLHERVRLHQEARAALANRGALPLCTPEERWQRAPTWAVVKDGNVKATKLCPSEAEALAVIGEAKKMHVEYRPGLAVRCTQYCAVKTQCQAYSQATGDLQWQAGELGDTAADPA